MNNGILTKNMVFDWANFTKGCQEIMPNHPIRLEKVTAQVDQDSQVDILDVAVFYAERVPENGSAEAIATIATQTRNFRTALQRQTFARVVVCPAKRRPSGEFKQSDDQLLMIDTMSSCLRLKPDFLTLFASDGDYAPMVWELRKWGIRTEVVGRNVAGELREAAYHVVDLEQLLEKIAEEAA